MPMPSRILKSPTIMYLLKGLNFTRTLRISIKIPNTDQQCGTLQQIELAVGFSNLDVKD